MNYIYLSASYSLQGTGLFSNILDVCNKSGKNYKYSVKGETYNPNLIKQCQKVLLIPPMGITEENGEKNIFVGKGNYGEVKENSNKAIDVLDINTSQVYSVLSAEIYDERDFQRKHARLIYDNNPISLESYLANTIQ